MVDVSRNASRIAQSEIRVMSVECEKVRGLPTGVQGLAKNTFSTAKSPRSNQHEAVNHLFFQLCVIRLASLGVMAVDALAT